MSSKAVEIVDDIAPWFGSDDDLWIYGSEYLQDMDYWYYDTYTLYRRTSSYTISISSGSVPNEELSFPLNYFDECWFYVVYSTSLGDEIRSSELHFVPTNLLGTPTFRDLGYEVRVSYNMSDWETEHSYFPVRYEIKWYSNGQTKYTGTFTHTGGKVASFTRELLDVGTYYFVVYYPSGLSRTFIFTLTPPSETGDDSIDVNPTGSVLKEESTASFFNWLYSHFNFGRGLAQHFVIMFSLTSGFILTKFLFFGVR